jgi:hypothetical protein
MKSEKSGDHVVIEAGFFNIVFADVGVKKNKTEMFSERRLQK